jgi:hypothetical protein
MANKKTTGRPAGRPKGVEMHSGLIKGTKGTFQLTGLTKAQMDWCNNLIKGNNRTQSARMAYPNSGESSAAHLAMRNWRNKNCQRYLEDQLMNSSMVDMSMRRLKQLVDATKLVPLGEEGPLEVPDNPVRLKAVENVLKLMLQIAKESPTDPEGAYNDTFWEDWYRQEYGSDPSKQELKEFKGKNIEVDATELQERLFSSVPVERCMSYDPADYIDD